MVGVVERHAVGVAGRGGDLDVLAAAGMAAQRGHALGVDALRLRSVWDGLGGRPEPISDDRLRCAFAGRVRELEAARAEAVRYFESQLLGFALRLPGFAAVRDGLALRAGCAAEVSAAVLLHWLDPTCPRCSGRRWQRVAGAPALSGKPCPACAGSGQRVVPGGEPGRVVADVLGASVGSAAVGMVKALRVVVQ